MVESGAVHVWSADLGRCGPQRVVTSRRPLGEVPSQSGCPWSPAEIADVGISPFFKRHSMFTPNSVLTDIQSSMPPTVGRLVAGSLAGKEVGRTCATFRESSILSVTIMSVHIALPLYRHYQRLMAGSTAPYQPRNNHGWLARGRSQRY